MTAAAGRPTRSQRPYLVLGFGSTHDTLAAEAALKAAGMSVAAVPAPRALGSLCGIALRLEPDDAACAEQALADARIGVTGRASIVDV